jgi:RimJ/RimL family protein N-acetyltransferase
MINPIKYLYFLRNDECEVIEVKRLDQEKNAPPEKVYKWLFHDRRSGKIVEFDFKSMKSSEGHELREFINASLRFNKFSGELILFDKKSELVSLSVEEISLETQKTIGSYFSLLNFLNDYNHPSHEYRLLKFSDVDCFYDWVNDDEVIRYSLTKFHEISSQEEILKWYLAMLTDKKCFSVGVCSRSGNLIGHAGIVGINQVDRNGEFFIFLGDKSYWRKGIASITTRDMANYGLEKLQLHRVFLTASSSNEGALKAYKRAGFIEEGAMRDAFFRNNQYSDKVFMGIVKSK